MVLSKKDLLEAHKEHEDLISQFKTFLKDQGTQVFEISSAQKYGLRDLVFCLWDHVKKEKGMEEDAVPTFDPIGNNKLF